MNYDGVAFAAWPGVFDGFDASGSFDARGVHRSFAWKVLYHLHGSVHHAAAGPLGESIHWEADLAAGTFDDGGPGRP